MKEMDGLKEKAFNEKRHAGWREGEATLVL